MIKTIGILIALIVFGTAADVPLMFLAVEGSVPIKLVFIAGVLIDIFSDLFWYVIGRKIGVERFFHWRLFKQKPERLHKISHAVDTFGNVILFTSKMSFGIGIPVQIIAGAHRYPIKKFLTINILATTFWFTLLYTLSKTLRSQTLVEHILKDAKFGFLAFIIIMLGISYLLSKISNRYLNKNK